MKGNLLTIFVIVVATSSFFNISSALNGAQEAGRVVLKNSQRVVYPTTEFPYTAMVEHKGKCICGAVIITLKAVLTAAHCVKGVAAKQFRVRAGTFTKLDETGSYVQLRKVERKYTPAEYNDKTFDHDIAVLILRANWNFNDYVDAVRLPQYVRGEPYANRQFVALGHGYNDYKKESQTLRKAVFKVLPRKQCLILHPEVAKDVLCVVGQDGSRGANYGDSGSPLIANHHPREPQNDVVIGITAYVFNAQDRKGYSAYTRVIDFIDWINKNI